MFKRFRSSEFLRHSSVLMLGTIVAQAIPILLAPVLSRIYEKADFALYNLFFGAIGILFIAFTLRYEQAIVLPKSDRIAKHIVLLTSLISVIMGILSFLLCFFIAKPISALLHQPAFEKWIFLLPPTLMFIGIYQGFNYYLTRHKQFKASAINRVVQRVVEGITNISLGVVRFPAGQLIGDFMGRLGVAIMSSSQSIKAGFHFKEFDKRLLIKVAQRYYQFAVIGSIPAIMNAVSSNIALFFVSSFYADSNCTADYGNSRAVLAIPLSIISVNLSQLLLQRFSVFKNEKKRIFPEVKNVFFALISFGIVMWLILQYFAPQIFAFVFKESWRSTGEVTAILAFGFAVRFAISPLSAVFTVFEEVKILSAWQVFYFIAIASLYFFRALPFYQFLWLLTIIEAVSYAIYAILIYIVVQRGDKRIGAS